MEAINGLEVVGTVRITREWLHACGHREFAGDTEFPVHRTYMRGGWAFCDVIVPWSRIPWTVIEWRFAK